MTAKKSNSTLQIVIGSIILVIIVIAVIIGLSQQRVSWSMTFNPEDKNPFGTKVIYSLMTEIRDDQKFELLKDSISKNLPEDPTQSKDTYFYIGQNYYGDSADVDAVLKFVKAGNNAFIFCNEQTNLLFDSLLRAPYDPYAYEDYYYDDVEYGSANDKRIYFTTDSILTLHLINHYENFESADIKGVYNFETINVNWQYFKDSLRTFEQYPTDALGYFDEGYSNYVRMKYGEGEIYFHSTPIAFTNYYMLNDTVMNYCRNALSYFGDGNIYWDEDNRIYDYKGVSHNPNDKPEKPGEGPLEFILSEPGLRTAWYLILCAAVLYLMFGAKRKQRIIQTTENMENTSIEYAEVLSQMFMKQSDHKKLVQMKMDLFRSFVRDRYHIKMPTQTGQESEELYLEISKKSNVPLKIISDTFELNKRLIKEGVVGTPSMLEIHQNLETFYNTCK